jgi:hypothetical protein
MDKAALVSVDISVGDQVVDILDKSGIQVSVALWIFADEYEDWRLILSGKQFDSLGLKEAYRLLNGSLRASGLPVERTPTIMILTKSDPFIRDLRKLFAKTKSVHGMRLGGQLFGDRFIQDAYVYRIS